MAATTVAPPKPKPKSKESPKPKSKKEVATPKQRIALLVGSIACFVLLLSVWHCTEALHVLTGSPMFLSALLAVGIDFGMVACEVASISGEVDGKAKMWAERYIVVAVVLSSGLNAFASGKNAGSLAFLATVVGALVPVLVFILAKVAGNLYKETG